MPCRRYRTLPRHSTQTQGRPIVVLSIDVGRHTGIHNYPFKCLCSDPIGKCFPDLPHTTANAQLILVWWLSSRSSVESVPYPPGLEPGTCGVRIPYTIRSPTAATFCSVVKVSHLKRYITFKDRSAEISLRSQRALYSGTTSKFSLEQRHDLISTF